MARLSLWLPPFSPDYSGASAVLFDLKTVTAMHDASGCTGNYTGYDDPRWFGSKSGIFCSGLRRIDAVLGGDEKLMEKMEAAAADIKPDLMALVGSPVPMVIGADLEGIAVELEERTKIPSFGFSTTGTAYYDRGAFMAAKALIERFTEKQPGQKGKVNILGALPMDFGRGEMIEELKRLLAVRGYEVNLCLAMGYTMEQLKNGARASVNLAVSRFGFLTAKYMEKSFGIPYLCGFPVGENGLESWFEALKEVEDTGKSRILAGWEEECPSASTLVVGEQVMCNSIRMALDQEMGIKDAAVACLYGLEKELSRPGDMELLEEKKIKEALNRPQYKRIIGDPFLKVLLPEDSDKEFIPISQYAVSSKLGEKDSANITGSKFNQWFKEETT